MLDVLRNAARGWTAKILLILLVGSFAVWGVSGTMLQNAASAVVTVGDTTVTPNEFRLAYDRQVAAMSRRFGTRLTSEQAKALGVPEQVYSQLIAGAALDEQARHMNLGLSDDRLAALVAEDPAFHDFNGRFDRGNFQRVLRSVGMSEADYIRSRSQVAVRTQIVEAVSDGFTAPDALIAALAQYDAESRDVDYLLLSKAAVPAPAAPDDAAVAAYYEANKARYEAPEYRKITYVKLEAEDIADPASISDEAVAADYESHKDRYSEAEKRAIDQLTFPDRPAADAVAARLANGETFDAIATELGRNAADIRIGEFTKATAPSPAIAEAAFAVPAAGGTTGVIDGLFGPVILRVATITPEKVKPLAEVTEEIRKELALAEANDQVLNVHDAFEDAIAGGLSLAEAAPQQKLSPVTIAAVDRAGQDPAGTVLSDLPASRELLAAAFEAEPGNENPPLSLGASGFLWYEVNTVTEKRQRPLEEVRDKVIADWTAEKSAEALGAKAAELAERIKKGETLEAIAAELSLAVENKFSLKRGDSDPLFGEAAVKTVFAGVAGHAGVATDASGENRIIFKVKTVNAAEGANAETVTPEERNQMAVSVADDILDQMVNQLRMQYGATVNRDLAERAMAL